MGGSRPAFGVPRPLPARRALALGHFDDAAGFGESLKPAPGHIRPSVADLHAPPVTKAHLGVAQFSHFVQDGHLSVFGIEKADFDILPRASARAAGRHGRRVCQYRLIRIWCGFLDVSNLGGMVCRRGLHGGRSAPCEAGMPWNQRRERYPLYILSKAIAPMINALGQRLPNCLPTL